MYVSQMPTSFDKLPTALPQTVEFRWVDMLKSPLARRLIGFTVLFSSLITFVASGLQLYIGFTQDIEAINATVKDIQSSRAKSIMESVWVLDNNLVQIQLDGIVSAPNIESAGVFIHGKAEWFSGSNTATELEEYAIPLIRTGANGRKTDLGELRVTADIGAIRERVRDAAVLVVISNAIKTFVVSLFFVVMFYFLIGRHLMKIKHHAALYTPGAHMVPITLARKNDPRQDDELSQLVESLNRMMVLIDEYRVKLSDNERIALQQAAELAVANEELEEFSSRTSHDLRAPILSALALLEFVNEALKDGMQEPAQEGIDHAIASLAKLKELIDNITQLTIIKKQDEAPEPIDFPTLLEESLKVLDHLDGFSTVEIRRSLAFQGPVVTRKMSLKTILDNLLSNAIKYQDPEKEQSVIDVRTYQEEGHFVLEVQDNGLGIPKEHENDLFKIFKRFHTKVAFGSGMGMHLMKSSANKLGASLNYVKVPDGAMFRLVVPVEASDEH